MPIKPHGGILVDLTVPEAEVPELEKRADGLARILLSPMERADLELLATGAYSPLRGFMGKADYETVVETGHLVSGLPWTLPVVLGADAAAAGRVSDGDEVALFDEAAGAVAGVMTVRERFRADIEKEAKEVFRTADDGHPGVQAIRARGEVLLGGPVKLLRRSESPEWSRRYLEPKETRLLFQLREWETVVAFQTRNPIHRAHEYLMKCALECVDGLMIHPLVGATKEGDIPADVRMACYEVILDQYLPKERAILSVFPAAMRYAGPKEAIFHAIVRKNFGCTHFIVGRDHAGVGSYYGTYDAHHIFREFDPAALGITPLFFDHSFYCRKCEGMATTKTCPHDPENRVFLSGTKVREMLGKGEAPPPEFTRADVARILIQAYAGDK
ncbi:MAG: sulfate adenylyltransferase [Nitrospinota bacterium]|nr:sulfate adenylyltransferase [Nitrospinota bacterium]MDP6618530.1 sulfate adenylyltransferase [Nitrospinota bacterium]